MRKNGFLIAFTVNLRKFRSKISRTTDTQTPITFFPGETPIRNLADSLTTPQIYLKKWN